VNDLRVVAITHKNFPLETIGKFHLSDDQRKNTLSNVKDTCGMGEVMYLSTCNRVEFVFTLPHYVCPGVTAQMLKATGVELSEEELEYEASERARDVSRDGDQNSPGFVLAVELPRKDTEQGDDGDITLSRAISIEEVDSLLLSAPGDDELQWFATQEIDLYLQGQVG
jgi:hypothetical protein